MEFRDRLARRVHRVHPEKGVNEGLLGLPERRENRESLVSMRRVLRVRMVCHYRTARGSHTIPRSPESSTGQFGSDVPTITMDNDANFVQDVLADL